MTFSTNVNTLAQRVVTHKAKVDSGEVSDRKQAFIAEYEALAGQIRVLQAGHSTPLEKRTLQRDLAALIRKYSIS